MPSPSRSGDVNSSSASAWERRVSDATFSPTARNARSEILPRSSDAVAVISALEALDGEGGVMATEAEAVAEYCGHVTVHALVGSEVEVELRIRVLVVDRRRNDSSSDDHAADDCFDGTCSAEHVSSCRFSR